MSRCWMAPAFAVAVIAASASQAAPLSMKEALAQSTETGRPILAVFGPCE